METELSEILTLAPAVWPGPPLDVQPGDLTKFAPSGMGLGAPMVLLPWDRLEDLKNRPSWYGYDTPSAHPFRNAPANTPTGGILYFDNRPEREEWEAVLSFLRVHTKEQEYAAFWERSQKPSEERYVEQLRLIPGWGLEMFGVEAGPQTAHLLAQKVDLGDALWAFLENQEKLYARTSYPWELSGILGGDGDWARESLAFGFMVENQDRGVYRIWSRAWLVTK